MTNTIDKIIHNGDEYLLPRQKALVITLTSAGWTNNEQTVTAIGVTASNSVIISPIPTDISDYTDAVIYCSAQGIDTLTFTCDTTPSNDIEVNVVILAEAGGTPTPPSPGWQPGVNTLAYYEFDNNLNDSSGNGHDLSVNAGTVTYGTDASGGKYVYFNQSTWTNQNTGIQYDVGNTTLLYWWKPKQIFSADNYVSIWYANTLGNTISTTVRSLEVWDMSPGYSAQVDTWYLVAVVTWNGTRTYYVNGNVVATGSYSLSGTSSIIFTINNIGNLYQSQYANDNYISQLIIEDKSWTQQEIQDYFDQTKGNYGIS